MIIASYYIATRVGLLELPDGFFYYVLGDFLLTGRLFRVFPFNHTVPQTLYGPLYSLFLGYLIPRPFPIAMTLIPFIQLCAVAVSGLMVRSMTEILIGKVWKNWGLLIFLFLPFLLIYATTLMSEAITLFLITTFCYLMILLLKKKTILPPTTLILVGCILALTKNAYIFIVLLGLLLTLFFLWRDGKTLKPIQGIFLLPPVLIGFFGIVLWMQFNWMYHKNLSLTNYTGRHLYNNVVHEGKMLPPKETEAYQEFMKRVGSEERLYLPEWEVQLFFIPEFNAGTLTESDMDRFFLNFSVAAIKAQPIRYAMHVVNVAWHNIVTPPYHAKLLAHLNEPDPTCPDCGTPPCRFTWDMNLCQPENPNKTMLKIWATLLQINRLFYPYGMTILTILASIGLLSSLLKNNRGILLLTGIFVGFLFVQAAAQRIEGRYLIPLYSIYAILIVQGIKTIVTLRHFKTSSHHET